MRFPHPSLRSLGLLLGLSVLSVGCGGEQEPSAADAGSTEITIEEEIPPTEAPEPTPAAPQEIPPDLPTFPGAERRSDLLALEGFGTLMMSSDRPKAEVFAFYQKVLPEQGWSVEEFPEQGRLSARKGDRTATLLIRENGEATAISLVFSGS